MKFTDWTAKCVETNTPVPEKTHIPDRNTPEYARQEESFLFQCSKAYNVGKWEAVLPDIDESKCYKIDVDYSFSGNTAQLFPAVFLLDETGHKLTMGYLQQETDTQFSGVVVPVPGSRAIKMEMLFRCFGEGKAVFYQPRVQELPVEESGLGVDELCVATAYFAHPAEGLKTMMEHVDLVEEVVAAAAKDVRKPDIMLFTETTLDRYLKIPFGEKFVAEDCPEMLRVREIAKKYGMHLVFSIHEDAEEAKYNTAYVIDDEGNIVGKHRKAQITYSELTKGVAPGEHPHAIETKFGKIGIVTCWEAWYPEISRELCRQGAKILMSPTAGFPEYCWQSRSRENGVPFVSCYSGDPVYCAIYSARGDKIAFIPERKTGYVSAVVPFGKKTYSPGTGILREDCLLGACPREIYYMEARKYR